MISLFSISSFFIFGLIAGSFLNCIFFRLEKDESFIKGRSYCPHCNHSLSWQDLIPILSFLFLKGKCRYCKKKISFQYPLMELISGILFSLIFFYWSFQIDFLTFSGWDTIRLFYYLIVFSFLLVIFVFDLKHFIIPDKVLYPAIIIAGIFNFQFLISNQFSFLKFSILSALGAALFFLLIFLISKGKWMGFGDVKLAFFMGLFLGWPNILVALFLAFNIGAVAGVILMIAGQKGIKSEIPFGPFLILGTFIAMFFGTYLIDWYWKLFLV